MTDNTDKMYALMMEGRMNLMHLPGPSIAWLWDRPEKQVDAAQDLSMIAKVHGNPVVDATLLRSDQNILMLHCENGDCYSVYPHGGYSHNSVPMDLDGCSDVLTQGSCDADMSCGMEHNQGKGELGGNIMPSEDDVMVDEVSGDVSNNIAGDTAGDTAGFDFSYLPSTGLNAEMPNTYTNLDVGEDIGGDNSGLGVGSSGMGTTGAPHGGTVPSDVVFGDDRQVDAKDFDGDCRNSYSDEELEGLANTMGTYEFN